MSKNYQNQDLEDLMDLGEKVELTAQPLNFSTAQPDSFPQRSSNGMAYPSTRSETGHYCQFLPEIAAFGRWGLSGDDAPFYSGELFRNRPYGMAKFLTLLVLVL